MVNLILEKLEMEHSKSSSKTGIVIFQLDPEVSKLNTEPRIKEYFNTQIML